jgi:hypothetical protein
VLVARPITWNGRLAATAANSVLAQRFTGLRIFYASGIADEISALAPMSEHPLAGDDFLAIRTWPSFEGSFSGKTCLFLKSPGRFCPKFDGNWTFNLLMPLQIHAPNHSAAMDTAHKIAVWLRD